MKQTMQNCTYIKRVLPSCFWTIKESSSMNWFDWTRHITSERSRDERRSEREEQAYKNAGTSKRHYTSFVFFHCAVCSAMHVYRKGKIVISWQMCYIHYNSIVVMSNSMSISFNTFLFCRLKSLGSVPAFYLFFLSPLWVCRWLCVSTEHFLFNFFLRVHIFPLFYFSFIWFWSHCNQILEHCSRSTAITLYDEVGLCMCTEKRQKQKITSETKLMWKW